MMNLISCLAVGFGGALGAMARYVLSSFIGMHGILIVNIIGCFIVGALVTLIALKTSMHQTMSLFLFVGVLGGFTTFSAFSIEAMAFIDTHRYMAAAAYIFASVGGGLTAFICGRFLVKTIL